MTDAAVSDDHDANCVPALWAAARRFLGRLIGLCGAPCVLVTDPFLSLKERRGILHWLRPVESLVRRLLVAEAVRIAETRPSGTDRRRAKVRRPVYPFCRVSFPDPENPATWAVRFSVSEPSIRKSSVRISPRIHVLDLDGHANVLVPAARNRAIAQHRERMRRTEEIPVPARMRRKRRPRAGSPWPLARRIEALTRVLENPELYARRLARRLRKNRDRLFRVCRPPPLLPPDEPPHPAETCIRQASERALEALEAFEYVGRVEAAGRNPPFPTANPAGFADALPALRSDP